MKKILLTLTFVAMAATIFAQSRPFEVTKNSYDPYIAEKSGFDSLFVNPAGMAGQTEVFVFEMEGRTSGKTKTYKTISVILENPELLSGSAPAQDPTPADMEVILELLLVEVEANGDLAALTLGTSLSGKTAAEILVYLQSYTLTPGEVNTIAGNIDGTSILENATAGLTQDLKVNVEATTKIGTLIGGLGIGFYGNVFTNLDAATFGVNPLIGETGIKVGYGFNLGPFGLGVSGDYAVIGNIASASIDSLMTTNMTYGYAWGIDAGVTFDLLPSLTLGAVMTDIIGSYSDAGTTKLEYLMNGASPSPIDYTYSFDLDLDFGVTWAPKIGNGKIIAPKLHADYYDFIGMFRPETQPKNFQDFINHMRFGAELELLSFINVKAMYYQEFFTLGAGVDLLFFEVFGEFLFNQEFTDIGGSVLVKLHF